MARLYVFRFHFEPARVDLRGLVQTAERVEHDPEALVCPRELRIELERLTQRIARFVGTFGIPAGERKLVTGFRRRAAGRNRSLELLDRSGRIADFAQTDAQVESRLL